MSHYRNGRDREYRVRDDMIAHGWHCVVRASSSKGAADLVMAHPDHGIALVQVGSRSKTLGPDARTRLCDLADMGGALALLAVVVPRAPIAYWQVNRGTPKGWERWEVGAAWRPTTPATAPAPEPSPTARTARSPATPAASPTTPTCAHFAPTRSSRPPSAEGTTPASVPCGVSPPCTATSSNGST